MQEISIINRSFHMITGVYNFMKAIYLFAFA